MLSLTFTHCSFKYMTDIGCLPLSVCFVVFWLSLKNNGSHWRLVRRFVSVYGVSFGLLLALT